MMTKCSSSSSRVGPAHLTAAVSAGSIVSSLPHSHQAPQGAECAGNKRPPRCQAFLDDDFISQRPSDVCPSSLTKADAEARATGSGAHEGRVCSHICARTSFPSSWCCFLRKAAAAPPPPHSSSPFASTSPSLPLWRWGPGPAACHGGRACRSGVSRHRQAWSSRTLPVEAGGPAGTRGKETRKKNPLLQGVCDPQTGSSSSGGLSGGRSFWESGPFSECLDKRRKT